MSLRGLIAGLSLLVCSSGCGWPATSGPSQVARGEYYAAGKPEFDSFFIALHQKQVELLAAPDELARARASLTATLDLLPDASDESLRERLAAEVRRLGNRGLRLRLETPPASDSVDASTTLHASDTTTETPLREALPRHTTRLVRLRNRLLVTQQTLEKLRVTAIQLESRVDEAFRVDGPWKRDEVRKNLSDGQKMITLMSARGGELLESDQRLLALVTEAATSDPSVGRVPTVAAAASEPQEQAPQRPARARPPQHRRPAAAGASPPRSDDEAPAVKPTQGSAPAEIEP